MPEPDKNRFRAELQHERGIGRSGNSARGKIRHRKLAVLRHPLDQVQRCAEIFGFVYQLLFSEHGELLHFLHDRPDMPHGFDDVARTRLALGTNHRRAFGNAPQGFAEIARAAHKRHLEVPLIDVVLFIGRCQDFALVDIIDAEGFEDARFREMPDARFCHHGNRNRRHDLADLADRRHARHTAFFPDIRRDALQRHHSDGAGLLGDHGLFGVDDVHNDAAFQHFRQSDFEPECFVLEQHLIFAKSSTFFLPVHGL